MPPAQALLLRLAIVLALVAPAVAGPTGAGPALAHPHDHGDAPRVLNPVPKPGDVVPPGTVRVGALVASDRGVEQHRLVVDGRQVDAGSSGGNHPTIAADVDLQPGWHTAQLVAANAAGEDQRQWRFRVGTVASRRLAGDGRVETAVRISQDRHPVPAPARAAVLARADDYPDALAGAALAAQVGGPLLLTSREALSAATAEELQRILLPTSTVHLLGGGAALSDQVRQDVEALGFRVERHHGRTREGTAVAIAAQLPETSTALVASGQGFADALSLSSPSAAFGAPILLTRRDVLPEETRAHLESAGYERLVVAGGTAAVSDAVLSQLRQHAGDVTRASGPTRFATAVAVAERFFPDATTVTVASGERFPDALAGGPHAAALGAPLLLVNADRLAAPTIAHLAARQPESAMVYGGTAAVGIRALHGVQRAVASAGGPAIVNVEPSDQVDDLEEVVIELDRDVVVEQSLVHVDVHGHEVLGHLGIGDFPSTLVFSVDHLPETIERGEVYEVVVTVATTDGQTWRHAQRSFPLRRPLRTLGRGDEGPEVAALQRRLEENRFWVGPIDGVYGTLTRQAVMALQKAHGLPIDGVFGDSTRAVLERDPGPPTPRSTSGFVYEVDLDRRILIVAQDGATSWVFNTSAGHGRWYEFQGSTYRATTTTGSHVVERQIDGMREAARGRLWRPKYYDSSRGIAIHGSTSVPAHHASAGCVRVTYAAMDFLWGLDPGTGAGVLVYPTDYYR